jgi:hypothetical protein
VEVKVEERERYEEEGTVFFEAAEDTESGGGGSDGERVKGSGLWLFERRRWFSGRWLVVVVVVFLRRVDIDGMMTWTKVLMT